jgi:hypothetical protein
VISQVFKVYLKLLNMKQHCSNINCGLDQGWTVFAWPSGVTHKIFFVHLNIILILVLGFYSGLSGKVRTVYLLVYV